MSSVNPTLDMSRDEKVALIVTHLEEFTAAARATRSGVFFEWDEVSPGYYRLDLRSGSVMVGDHEVAFAEQGTEQWNWLVIPADSGLLRQARAVARHADELIDQMIADLENLPAATAD